MRSLLFKTHSPRSLHSDVGDVSSDSEPIKRRRSTLRKVRTYLSQKGGSRSKGLDLAGDSSFIRDSEQTTIIDNLFSSASSDNISWTSKEFLPREWHEIEVTSPLTFTPDTL